MASSHFVSSITSESTLIYFVAGMPTITETGIVVTSCFCLFNRFLKMLHDFTQYFFLIMRDFFTFVGTFASFLNCLVSLKFDCNVNTDFKSFWHTVLNQEICSNLLQQQ